MNSPIVPIYLVASVRSPFLKAGGPFSHLDSVALSVPVAQTLMAKLGRAKPDTFIWGTVIPNLPGQTLRVKCCRMPS